MREIHVREITRAVKELCIKACCYLGDDVKKLLKQQSLEETPNSAKYI